MEIGFGSDDMIDVCLYQDTKNKCYRLETEGCLFFKSHQSVIDYFYIMLDKVRDCLFKYEVDLCPVYDFREPSGMLCIGEQKLVEDEDAYFYMDTVVEFTGDTPMSVYYKFADELSRLQSGIIRREV